MKIAVCDDEKIFTDMICSAIEEHYKSLDTLCTCFRDGSEVIAAFRSGKRFDAVFLDIEMGEVSGMKAAEEIRRIDPDVILIFLTSHVEYAMEGYEVGAFRFLQKPVQTGKLTAALRDIEKRFYGRNTLMIKEKGSEIFLSPDDVIYVASENNDVRIVTPDREYRTRMKISEAYEMLTKHSPWFCRIHRCTVVNLRHVAGYKDNEVRTDNGEVIPMSRKLSKGFTEEIRRYIHENAV